MGNLIVQLVNSITVSSIAHEEVTFTFSEPQQAGVDVTGRAWVLDPGSGVTVSSITPAQTTSPSDSTIINGAMLNINAGGILQLKLQGFYERANNWSATVNETPPVSMAAGDVLVKTIAVDPWTIRNGSFSTIAVLHCVSEAPTANQVLGPSTSVPSAPGGALSEWYTANVDAWYSSRTVQSHANTTWPTYSSLSRLLKCFPTLPAFTSLSTSSGYEYFSPNYFGEADSGQTGANFGQDIGNAINAAMCAITTNVYSEEETKSLARALLMHGIEWCFPFMAWQSRYIGEGAHNQFHIGPGAFAVMLTGAYSHAAFLNYMPGNAMGDFKVTSDMLSDFSAHTDLSLPFWARQRTLPAQPGGATLRIPLTPVNVVGVSSDGGDYISGGMPVGTRVVRVSDGATATLATDWNVDLASTQDLTVAVSNPFSENDVVYMEPPIDEPLQVGSYQWTIRGYDMPPGSLEGLRYLFCPWTTAAYFNLNRYAGQLMAIRALGINDSVYNNNIAMLQIRQRSNYPSSTNDFPVMASDVGDDVSASYYAENWDAAWNVITSPSAFVAGNWTLSAGGAVSITALPDCGGLIITDIEYRLGGGAWVSADSQIAEYSVLNSRTITFTIPSYAGENVEIRALNFDGTAGAASDIKTA